MTNIRMVILITSLFVISGCAVTMTPQPTGGSRADGTVELSYEYGSMQQVTIDEAGALEGARQRCQAWGYEDAEAFGGVKRNCQQSGQYGCNRYFATLTYQCFGGRE